MQPFLVWHCFRDTASSRNREFFLALSAAFCPFWLNTAWISSAMVDRPRNVVTRYRSHVKNALKANSKLIALYVTACKLVFAVRMYFCTGDN